MASNAKIIGDLIAADSSVAIPGDGVILASDLADGSVTTAKLADANVTTGKIATTVPLGTKNLIINGDMRIAQRGTSTSSYSTSGYPTIDRFQINVSALGVYTVSQDTSVPTGQGFVSSLKMLCTTADASPASNDYLHIVQKIEAQNLQHLKFGTANAESLTLSFWVKSNKTGTYVLMMYRSDSSRLLSKTYTITAADTWEKKTITVDGDTTGSINNDNGEGINLYWFLASGSSRTSGTANTDWGAYSTPNEAAGLTVNLSDATSNYFNITGVQLEVGTEATPFENRMYSTELAMCERYYQKNYLLEDAPGVATSGENTRYMHGCSDGSSNAAAGVFWRSRMRATPTVTWYTDGGTQGQWNYSRSGASGTGSFIAYRVGDTGANGYMGVGAAWVTCSVWGNWTANAEL